MPTDGHAGMTSCVSRSRLRMSSVCQTMRFGSGATVPSSQSACPSLLTRQSLGPRYLPETTTCTGTTGGAAAALFSAAARDIGEPRSIKAASRPPRVGARGMPITVTRVAAESIVRWRRQRRHARRPIVDASEGELGSAAGEAQRHHELAVLRQAVGLDDFRSELRPGLDHVVGSLPTRYLLCIALLGRD